MRTLGKLTVLQRMAGTKLPGRRLVCTHLERASQGAPFGYERAGRPFK